MINEAAAKRFFASQDPIGQQIRLWGAARTVIGIVGDERFHGLAAAAPPAVYTPLDQTPSVDGSGVLLVRVDGAPASLAAAVRAAVREQDPGLAVFGLEPLDDTLARSVAERRFTVLVLGLLAAWRCCWRQSASTACSVTRWGSAPARSAFASRLAPRPAGCAG